MTSDDPTDTRLQEALGEARERQIEETRRQETEDIKWLVSDKRGRRIVWGLLERAGVFRTSFTGNSETFFREGARNIGLAYTALLIENCPEAFTRMITEGRDERQSAATGGRTAATERKRGGNTGQPASG